MIQKVNLMDCRKAYKDVVNEYMSDSSRNSMHKLNFEKKVYAELKQNGIDLKARVIESGTNDPFYYYFNDVRELELFKSIASKLSSTKSNTEEKVLLIEDIKNTKDKTTKEEKIENTKDNETIYLEKCKFIKYINRINKIYLDLNDSKKELFAKNLLKQFTIQSKNQCNLYNRNAKDIAQYEMYIEDRNDFIINLLKRLDYDDNEYIVLAIKSTKEILQIA